MIELEYQLGGSTVKLSGIPFNTTARVTMQSTMNGRTTVAFVDSDLSGCAEFAKPLGFSHAFAVKVDLLDPRAPKSLQLVVSDSTDSLLRYQEPEIALSRPATVRADMAPQIAEPLPQPTYDTSEHREVEGEN